MIATSDVNDADLRLLVIDAEPILSFSEKKTNPSRNDAFLKLHFNTDFYTYFIFTSI